MLPAELLIYRTNGDKIIPKRLPLDSRSLGLAEEQINCFQTFLGTTQRELDEKLAELESDSPDYRIRRGLTHILKNNFSTFEIISPLDPQLLRQRVFREAVSAIPLPQNRPQILEITATNLSQELKREVLPHEIEKGLYADLQENRILTQFDTPSVEELLHRYNLSQVQGIFYRASDKIGRAHV